MGNTGGLSITPPYKIFVDIYTSTLYLINMHKEIIQQEIIQRIIEEGWIYEGQSLDEPTGNFSRTYYRSPNRKFLLNYVHMGDFANYILYYKYNWRDSSLYEQIACFPQEDFLNCGSKPLLFEIFI